MVCYLFVTFLLSSPVFVFFHEIQGLFLLKTENAPPMGSWAAQNN